MAAHNWRAEMEKITFVESNTNFIMSKNRAEVWEDIDMVFIGSRGALVAGLPQIVEAIEIARRSKFMYDTAMAESKKINAELRKYWEDNGVDPETKRIA